MGLPGPALPLPSHRAQGIGREGAGGAVFSREKPVEGRRGVLLGTCAATGKQSPVQLSLWVSVDSSSTARHFLSWRKRRPDSAREQLCHLLRVTEALCA